MAVDELKVPATIKFKVLVTNKHATRSAFESNDFDREKMVLPGSTATVFTVPLDKESHECFDDFHQDIARGVLIVERIGMLRIALLVFHEVLEEALLVTIVAAATHGVRCRAGFIGGGAALGLTGFIVVAMFAGVIELAEDRSGQEWSNACVLLAAVTMIAWHVIWMRSRSPRWVIGMRLAARRLASTRARQVDSSVATARGSRQVVLAS